MIDTKNTGQEYSGGNDKAIDRFNPQAKLAAQESFIKFLKGEKVYPINIEISPSHTCTATCPWCFYAGTHVKKSAGMMDKDILMKLIKDLRLLGLKGLSVTGGGDPSLYPHLSEAIELAYSLNIKLGMFTNALTRIDYNPSRFEWIRVSNTDHPWPIKNLEYLRKNTKVLGLAYNYAGNDDEIVEALKIGKQIGVDYVQVRQALNLRGLVTDREPPKIDDPLLFVTKYKFDDSSNPHGYSKCYGYNFTPFVWNDGDVSVCGYMKKEGYPYVLGNLHKNSIKEILDAAPIHVPVKETCQVCCKLNESNKLINNALNLKDPDFV